MTDKELLELAAKAAGINWKDWTKSLYLDENGLPEKTLRDWPYDWNPLTNDAAALQLAVDLKIDVKHYDDHVVAWFNDFFGTGKVYYNDDPYAATRRAIVRAAAELSKEKA